MLNLPKSMGKTGLSGHSGHSGNPGLPGFRGFTLPVNPLTHSMFEIDFEGFPLLKECVKNFNMSREKVTIGFYMNEYEASCQLGLKIGILPLEVFKTNKKFNVSFNLHDKTGKVIHKETVQLYLLDFSYWMDYSSQGVAEIESIFTRYEH